jgi:hypothetical protein
MSFDREKHNTIVSLFKQGRRLSEIAKEYSISKQRIGQILAARGVKACEGGRALTTSIRRATEKANKERAHFEKYGCSIAQLKAVRGERRDGAKAPFYAFDHQLKHAKSRGIKWELKFWDWWTVWENSGKWAERGRGKTGYCMCRVGDEGAYAIGNIYIATVCHNSTMGRTLAHERAVPATGFRALMIAAGGRMAVSERLGLPRTYLSQLGNDGHMPRSWLSNGRAQLLVEMTCGAYSLADVEALIDTSGSQQLQVLKEAA